MPKLGMEPVRRRALIEAAIETIGAQGSLDVTMGRIAEAAGVSPALAHHYFGGKDRLLIATMRHLLSEFGRLVAAELRRQETPRARISAVVAKSFAPEQFAPGNVAAWLAFYVRAQSDPEAQRLLRVYKRRVHSNLVEPLARLAPRADAERIADGTAAMIDGLYIRRALRDGGPDAEATVRLVERHVDDALAALARREG
ncbi:MAG TPA: transcriptional regulator BetI [Thermohalobaculum sp.]|nr:transcriptional regulator BetI [Thermohalobaculum sp.]